MVSQGSTDGDTETPSRLSAEDDEALFSGVRVDGNKPHDDSDVLRTDGGYTADEIIRQLRGDGDLHILTEGQAEALAHRDVLDHSRSETAEVLGISMSAVDNRLRGARKKLVASARLVRIAHSFGAYSDSDADVIDDLRTEITEGSSTEVTEDDHEDNEILDRLNQLTHAVDQLADEQRRYYLATDEDYDDKNEIRANANGSARLWGHLMIHPETKAISRTDGTLTVTLDNPENETIDEARGVLRELGYMIWNVNEQDSDRVKIRARKPDEDE